MATASRRDEEERGDAMALDPDSYTAMRLQHSTAEHLHITSRRFFIGPIPEGWLKTHRRDWYKDQLHINYSRRATTFSPAADRHASKQRRLTGLDGPSASALFQHSFPQPKGLHTEDIGESVGEGAARATKSAPSKLDIPPAPQVIHKEVVASPESDVFVDAESDPESDDADGLGEENLRVYTHEEEPDSATGEASKPTRRPPARTQSSTKSFVTASSTPGVIEPIEVEVSEPEEHRDQGGIETQSQPVEDDQINTSNPPNGADANHQASSLQVQDSAKAQGKRPVFIVDSSPDGASPPSPEATSTTSLLRNTDSDKGPGRFDPTVRLDATNSGTKQPATRGILTKFRSGPSDSSEASSPTSTPSPLLGRAGESLSRRKSNLRNLVKFDIPEDSKRASIHFRAKQAQMTVQRASTKLRRHKIKDGLVVKMERMLVRVDAAAGDVPDEFDENANQKVDSRVKDKWREYMVVCRHSSSDEAEFVLQMYKTRVIPEIENPNASKRAAYQIPLGRKVSKVNLYSSLDKSVVVWMPSSRGTLVFIMQARTSSNAVEWYTFLRNIMGWRRSSELKIHVPDMSISLQIADPFKSLEASQREAQEAADSDNEEVILRTMQEEQAVAESLIRRCLEQLEAAPEWTDVLESWTRNQRIGLAWKRYDRLEWIHGANERRMYGTIAMSKSHDLELRPKSHYPTTAVTRKKHITLTEPVPVEGFLVRLTSQRGQAKRLGLMFHKQLYFSSHDQYLVFSRPTNATPPPPPKLRGVVRGGGGRDRSGSGFSAATVAEEAPDTWDIDPYPTRDGRVQWLMDDGATPESIRQHDEEAADEAARKSHNLLNSDGYINLANVVKVRKAQKGASPVDANIESGSDVDFDDEGNAGTGREDGVTTDVDLSRTLELVMRNGLIVRLQAADTARRKVWITHLRALAKYWKFRTQTDISLLKSTRARNLSALNIDEQGEAYIGQFARKWEVTQSFASPLLYNMCGIASCRAIHMSGTLYRKPRIHAPFTRCSVLLAAGSLLVFQDVLRSRTGKHLPHIHHERLANLDLKDCYVYSGLLTETDLLYQNQTFDANKPGHHALPRIYLDDGAWTSSDEDVMTTFVVWHGRSKSWFRSAAGTTSTTTANADVQQQQGEGSANGETRRGEVSRQPSKRGKLKRVAKLGSKGRSLVFRARSRAERDRWVLALRNEIERVNTVCAALGMGGEEDVRIEEGAFVGGAGAGVGSAGV